MKNLLLILFISINVTLCYPQERLVYTYDYAGNRVIRIYYPNRMGTPIDTTHSSIDNAVISIYPNPTVGQLTVQVTTDKLPESSKIEVFDNIGRLVISKSPITESNSIDISAKTNGEYFLKVTINGKSRQWNIVKVE